MAWTLIVDAGGTRTRAVIGNENGELCAYGQAGPGNFHAMSAEQWVTVVQEAVHKAKQQIPFAVGTWGRVWVGSAGLDTPENKEKARHLVRMHLFDPPCLRITNDAALLCPHEGRPSVVAIAGTGSIVLAFDKNGQLHGRIGGLGWILGDEGSAYCLGRAALRAILQRPAAETSRLQERVADLVTLSTMDDILSWVYTGPEAKTRVASVAPCVTRLAREGDPLAWALVDAQAYQLAKQIADATTCARAEDINVRLGGALLQDATFQRCVVDHLTRLGYAFASIQAVPDACVAALAAWHTAPHGGSS